MGKRPFLYSGLAVGVALGCAAAAEAQRKATQDLAWPAAPEKARIRYVGSWNSTADLGVKESFFGRLGRSVTGSPGMTTVQVRRPFDVGSGPAGVVYVTDALNPYILAIDPVKKEVRKIGLGMASGLAKPTGLTVDERGSLYVADAVRKAVFVFHPDGTLARTLGGPTVLRNPQDVAVDTPGGRIYVVDSYLHQVVVFDQQGAVVARLGKTSGVPSPSSEVLALAEPIEESLQTPHAASPNSPRKDVVANRSKAVGEFSFPFAAAVGLDGRLYVTDQMNFRVQVFDRQGTFVRAIGFAGDGPGAFARVKGVAVDRYNHVYVTDAAFSNVQVFDADGGLLMFFGSLGRGEGQLLQPLGIAVDAEGGILVADRYNSRVQLFRLVPMSEGSGQSP